MNYHRTVTPCITGFQCAIHRTDILCASQYWTSDFQSRSWLVAFVTKYDTYHQRPFSLDLFDHAVNKFKSSDEKEDIFITTLPVFSNREGAAIRIHASFIYSAAKTWGAQRICHLSKDTLFSNFFYRLLKDQNCIFYANGCILSPYKTHFHCLTVQYPSLSLLTDTKPKMITFYLCFIFEIDASHDMFSSRTSHLYTSIWDTWILGYVSLSLAEITLVLMIKSRRCAPK